MVNNDTLKPFGQAGNLQARAVRTTDAAIKPVLWDRESWSGGSTADASMVRSVAEKVVRNYE